MSFDDLPRNWSDLSLTEPRLVADVLDLMIGLADRRTRSIAVLACDSGVRLIQPMMVESVPSPADPELMHRAVGIVVEALGGIEPEGRLILAFTRPTGLSVTPDDVAWTAAALEALAPTAWSLSSAHVVTLEGSRPIPV